MDEEKIKEFMAHSEPLIKWLNDNCHPHTTIIIDPTSAQVFEGSIVYSTDKYLKD